MKLQKIQNRAARLIYQVSRLEHTSPLINELHWLTIKNRITYKVLLLVYKTLNNLAPIYLSDILSFVTPDPEGMHLRSHADKTRLVSFRTRSVAGDKAFANCGPKLWNSLPTTLRHSKSVSEFKTKLKTYLFQSVPDV